MDQRAGSAAAAGGSWDAVVVVVRIWGLSSEGVGRAPTGVVWAGERHRGERKQQHGHAKQTATGVRLSLLFYQFRLALWERRQGQDRDKEPSPAGTVLRAQWQCQCQCQKSHAEGSRPNPTRGRVRVRPGAGCSWMMHQAMDGWMDGPDHQSMNRRQIGAPVQSSSATLERAPALLHACERPS